MTIREIRLWGDPVLRQRTAEVDSFDAELRSMVADLWDTLEAAPGRGLAAPQIGVSQSGSSSFTSTERAPAW